MKLYKGFALLIGLALILTSCGSPDVSREVRARQVTCSQVIVIPVFDLDGNLITKFVSGELKSHYEYDANEGMYNRYPDNMDEWNAFYDQINAGIKKANAQFANLYAQSALVKGVSFSKLGPEEGKRFGGTSKVDLNPCPDSNDPNQTDWDWYDGIRFLRGQSCDAEAKSKYYCADITVVGDITYVTVSTPGGSWVDYSHPTAWINQIMRSSFGDKEPLDFSPRFVSPEILLDQQAYGESLLRTLVGDGDGQEVAFFTLVVSDFEGRNELRPVIARAMEVAAVQTGHAVVMTLKGMMSNGQYTVANISAHQDGIKVNGWMALTFGSVNGSGGEMNLEANYTSNFEDLVHGSIYVLNP